MEDLRCHFGDPLGCAVRVVNDCYDQRMLYAMNDTM